MEGREINALLASRAEEVVALIYPEAKIRGGRAYVGDIAGNPGDSLVIELGKEKAGVWCDFAADERGDITQLWINGKCGGDQSEAFKEIRSFLKLPPINNLSKFQSTVKKEYEKPTTKTKKLDKRSAVQSYLLGRGISEETLKFSKVRQTEDGKGYIFLYHDLDGKVCLTKTVLLARDGGKKKSWTSPKSKPVLFGMRTPPPENAFKGMVVICEGEVDALSLRECGIFAVSVPYGAKNHQWTEHCLSFVQSQSDIVIFFDGDEEGRQGASGLSSCLGEAACRVVQTPEGDDCNKILLSKGKDYVLELIKEAKNNTPERFRTGPELMAASVEVIKRGPIKDQGDDFMGWTDSVSVNWKLRPKELTVWTGYPNHGKSQLIYQLIAHLVFVLNKRVAIASLEVPATELLIHIVNAALARTLRKNDIETFQEAVLFADNNIMIYDFIGTAPVKDVVSFAEYACNIAGADHFFLDSITKTDLDVEDLKETNKFMSAITTSMFATGAHYHIVAHARKGDSTSKEFMPGIDQVKGSTSIGAETFNVVTVWRNMTKEENIIEEIEHFGDDDQSVREIREKFSEYPDGYFRVSKQKNSSRVGKYKLWFNESKCRFKRSNSEKIKPYIGKGS